MLYIGALVYYVALYRCIIAPYTGSIDNTDLIVYAYDQDCCIKTTLMIYTVLRRNNCCIKTTWGEGLWWWWNIVGATTVYKIVKKDYIALQCKSLKLKEEINRDRVDNKGTQSRTESAHRRDYVAGLRRPIKPMESRTGGTLVLKEKTTKYLTKMKKYDIVRTI